MNTMSDETILVEFRRKDVDWSRDAEDVYHGCQTIARHRGWKAIAMYPSPEAHERHIHGTETPIDLHGDLDLSVRARNACEREGVTTVEQFQRMLANGVLHIRNCGKTTEHELRAKFRRWCEDVHPTPCKFPQHACVCPA